MATSEKWCDGKEIDYAVSYLNSSKEDLINAILNDTIGEMSNFKEHENNKDIRGYGKKIPYIGWYWRSIDFFNNNVYIGNSGEFIGIMQNNKWSYPERKMTDEEYVEFKTRLYQIMSFRNGCGDVSKNFKKMESLIDELWDWMQTLKIDD